ncbi:MAG: CpsD/CapB family tyrosine-protein kinase [Planctomycetes bacterium]|nr:CpsD/CapB family tyrosine-protein kinase [Planctomycetota bacterium]
MGDVFDAMKRSRKERETKPDAPRADSAPAPAAPARPQSDDARPALPMDQVHVDRSDDHDDAPTQAVERKAPAGRGVSAAVDRAKADLTADPSLVPGMLPSPAAGLHDPALNGYSSQIVVHHDRGSVITEQYRAIRTQILARARNRRLQTHVITSSAPEEGKSVTSVNLGVTFSELRSQKTLLIEADLRKPSFQNLFRRNPTPGLTNYLRGEVDSIDKILHPSVYPNLQIIPAGDRDVTGSTELLSSPRMAALIERLKDRYEHIFIDTPPVVTVTDACILGALCDETLLVVRLGKTPAGMVERAKRLLRFANCDVAGVILTHLHLQAPKYLYRYA